MAAARIGELAVVLATAAVLRRGLRLRGAGGWLLLAAAGAGVIDVVANICYVAATRTGMFGLAVVLASLYPGITVLLARVVLREQLRWVQRAGLGLAAIGILLVAASSPASRLSRPTARDMPFIIGRCRAQASRHSWQSVR